MLLAIFLLSILSSLRAASAEFCRRPNAGLLVMQNSTNPGAGMNGFTIPLFDNNDNCQFRKDGPLITPNGADIPTTAQVIKFIQLAFEDDIGNDLDQTSLGLLLNAMEPWLGYVPSEEELFYDFVVCTVVFGNPGSTILFGGLKHGQYLDLGAAMPIVSYQCYLDF
ncbi:hypothetical protein B0T19DRAFT_416997, partial [Cercophora scortea]